MPHAYIGMIGSRKRVAKVKEVLIENGTDPEVLNQGLYAYRLKYRCGNTRRDRRCHYGRDHSGKEPEAAQLRLPNRSIPLFK